MNEKTNEIVDDCMARLEGMLPVVIPPLTRLMVKALFEFAYYHGNRDGFREALDIAHDSAKPR